MYELTAASTQETREVGKKLGMLLATGDIVALFGDLGTGKTVFTQGLAQGLGVHNYVTSPTFVLINEYPGRLPLYHFDVYRLEDPEEILELGYEEYFYGEGVSVIEWAEKIVDYLPHEYLGITLEKTEPLELEGRRLAFQPRGKRYVKMVEELIQGC
nr:tRNA (adenosine(37)-N6)-threonylcarbamoyltransferase complex ATPase subunit type 1 TsaE [Candidatus Contubernalis alkalaceticus]